MTTINVDISIIDDVWVISSKSLYVEISPIPSGWRVEALSQNEKPDPDCNGMRYTTMQDAMKDVFVAFGGNP